jgi:hypothetical protein
MNDVEVNAMLNFCLERRIALANSIRPEKAWIALHQPVAREVESSFINSSVSRAWLLENERVQERPVHVFSRFAAAHMDKPWLVGEIEQPRSPIFDRYKHEFGIVRFAQLQNTEEYMLEMSWGGLNGRGMVIGIQNLSATELRGLWKS